MNKGNIGLAAAVVVMLGALTEACASKPAEAPKAQETAAHAPRRHDGQLSVSAELGEIDQEAVSQTFVRLEEPFQGCFAHGIERVEYEAGDFQVFARIGANGKARYAYLEETTLGDRDTERCIVESVLRASFPRPAGGEAEVRKRIGFDSAEGVRPPEGWPAAKGHIGLRTVSDAINACKAAAPGAMYTVTLYVAPVEGEEMGGRVVSAGVSTTSLEGSVHAQCIIDAVKGAKMPSPGSYAAKVSLPI